LPAKINVVFEPESFLFFNILVLARRLKNRPDRDDLVGRNIIPGMLNYLNM